MIQGDPESPPDDSTFLMLAAAFAALSVATALCRYGLDSLSKTRVLQDADEARRPRLERWLDALDRTTAGALVLWTASDAAFVLLLHAGLVGTLGLGRWAGMLTTAVVASLVLVAITRTMPRLIAERDVDGPVLKVLPILHVIGLLLSPLSLPALGIRRGLERMLGSAGGETATESFTDELIATVAEGEREGVVDEDEADMIENVVEMRECDVSEIMTPRTDIDWVDSSASVFEALRLASEARHSRVPVGEEDSDHIVGVFYVRDVIDKLVDIETLKDLPVKQICRKPVYVPETKNISDMLREFRSNKIHMAIVLDEYGGTAGLVTIEDILEEIVGEIDDEYDTDEGQPVLEKINDDRAQVDARIYIEDLNEALDVHLPEDEDFDTVGGFVFSHLGRVPQRGERFAWEGLDVQVLDADERRVKLLEVNVLERVNGNAKPRA